VDTTGGLANFRDVGGLPTDDGAVTRTGILYRSDAPLPGDNSPSGSPWPPVTVIDLRSADEPIEPHPLQTPTTLLARFPLLGEARPRTLRELQAGGNAGLDVIYRKLVTRVGENASAILELLVTANGPTLIHCAAGKDRTGVLIAALLRAAGVTTDAIVADYVRTDAAMASVRRRISSSDEEVAALIAQFPEAGLAPADAITGVLQQVDGSPGGIAHWLASHGVPTALLNAWRDKLVHRYTP
jgi:protein-tyrosine phosphatase